ncbi:MULTISPECIES: S9 family peptidase [Psychrobacter]|uniref:alpha/beta hydrolase family protein n=1 Tax=Psychrobacter TaxID=497 RepID=UPI00146AD4E9|nr:MULTISPECIES: dienelactone hydrolase family protein [Psychrobacter]
MTPSFLPKFHLKALSLAVVSSLLLVGCNDDNETVYFQNTPETIKSFTADKLDTALAQISPIGKAITPDAKCGVVVEKFSYQTQGSAGEAATATAALMLPSGTSADCQGERPLLLHAHGTATEKSYDFTQVGNGQNQAGFRATLMAANFAAQGYIVLVPNYAGYDKSDLNYHPYLNAKQQSQEMVTALDTARRVIAEQQSVNNPNYQKVKDSGKLFLTGYSQGGHVAMATAKLLESQNRPVTALAPSSGPYALAAFGDAIFGGNVNVGATAFAPLIARSLQPANPKIYTKLSDIFNKPYDETLLPTQGSFNDLIKNGKLPQTALFQAAPTGIPSLDPISPPDKFGFADKNYLIRTDYRAQYLADAQANPDGLLVQGGNLLPANNPQQPLREALKANDLRGYAPAMPTFICGGNQDPTVFYDLNTGSMSAILQKLAQTSHKNLNVTVFDVDATNKAQRPSNNLLTLIGTASANPWQLNDVATRVQSQFAKTVDATSSAAYQQALDSGATVENAQKAAQAAVLSSYHGTLASTACTEATREFFDQNFVKVKAS